MVVAGSSLLASSAMASPETGILKPRFSEARANFERVRRMILTEHMGDIDEQRLYLAATRGMLEALNEPGGHRWNALLSPNEMKEFAVSLRRSVTGIGVNIKFIPSTGTAYIQQVLEGSPAFEAGIREGDQIIAVNGTFYKGKTQMDLSRDIRGPAGKSVELKILRGAKVFDKVVVRKKVTWGPVESKFAGNIGILKIRSFTQGSPDAVKEHLGKLKEAKGLVVDLRSNVGGILDQAISSTDLLLPKGKVVAYLRGRKGKVRVFRSTQPQVLDVPMIVLIDRKTSAGAELMAASLKENLGVRLVGEKTFGKWNSQVIRRLPNNFAVKYTVSEFMTPQKRLYSNVGLPPDVTVTGHITRMVSLEAPNLANRPKDPQMHTALQMIQLMQ